VDFVKGCIDLAPDVGTSVVHMMAGATPAGVARERAWGWLLEGIAACARYASEQGVILAFEACAGTTVANMADLNKFLADLGEEKLYINFDASHLVLAGDNPIDCVRTLGSRIVHAHAKDARHRLPSEGKISIFGHLVDFEFPPLGKGIVDLREVVGALREIGYQGFLSVEYEAYFFGYHKERWDPWEAAAQSKRFMDDLLSG